MRKLFLLLFLIIVTNQAYSQNSAKIISIKMHKQGLDVDGDGYARFRVFTVEVESNFIFEAEFYFYPGNDTLPITQSYHRLEAGINTIQIAVGGFSKTFPHSSYNYTLSLIQDVMGHSNVLDSISYLREKVLENIKIESNMEDGGTKCFAFINTKLSNYIDKDEDGYSQALKLSSSFRYNSYYNRYSFKFYNDSLEIFSLPDIRDNYYSSNIVTHNIPLQHKEYNFSIKAFYGEELVGELGSDELNNIFLEPFSEDNGVGIVLVDSLRYKDEDYDGDNYSLGIFHNLIFDVNSPAYEVFSKFYYKKRNDSNWTFINKSQNFVLNGFSNSKNKITNYISNPYGFDSSAYDLRVEIYSNDESLLFTYYGSSLFENVYQDLKRNSTSFQNRFYDTYISSLGNISDNLIYSGGFFLSGKTENNWWSNGNAKQAGIVDYQPGKIDNNINFVFNLDSWAFNSSWKTYRFAVDLGLEFIDGNKDGIFNPIDKNNNSIVDNDEDAPNLYGSYSAISIYNDNKPAINRKFNTQNPLGIEVIQTSFVYDEYRGTTPAKGLFVKYKLINKSGKDLDSVIFSPWADIDLGSNDLVGTLLECNGMYVYNKDALSSYGSNAPVMLLTLFQGPVAYKPGISFNDLNNDQIFTNTLDLPLDTAVNYKGNLGKTLFPGAMNLGIASTTQYAYGTELLMGADNVSESINYAKGLDKLGSMINPCNWSSGTILNADCKNNNPLFKYVGDPFNKSGWLNTNATDQRVQINTESFELKKDSSAEIIIAYIYGYGYNGTSSFDNIRNYYNDLLNRFNLPKMIANVNDEQVVTNFEVYQNYPNPFNPVTNIKFNLAKSGLTKVKVFDLLGREIQVLVDDVLPQGLHNIPFNGSKLSSGVYFYSVESDNNKMIKKMVLLK